MKAQERQAVALEHIARVYTGGIGETLEEYAAEDEDTAPNPTTTAGVTPNA